MVQLRLSNIRLKYQNSYILDNFSLTLDQGQLLVILGESGCGKTTLLKIIAGIISPESGEIWLDNVEYSHYSPQQRNFGYVPQAQILFPHMTVLENLSFGLKAHHFSKIEIKEKIHSISELTQIADLLSRLPNELSGGQKQRVALARTLVLEPKLILLDEPLSSIDANGREELALVIRRIQQITKTTMIYVTHSQDEARLIADQIAIIYDGQIQQFGLVSELENHPKNYQVAKLLGLDNVFPISFQWKEEQQLVNLPFGSIIAPSIISKNVTACQLPPSGFKILTMKEYNEQITQLDKNIYLQGTVISYHKTESSSFSLMVSINPNTSIFLRIISNFSDLIEEPKQHQYIYFVIPFSLLHFF